MFNLLLLFAHLLGTSLALGAIVATDIRLLRRLADDRVRIAPPNPYVMRLMTIALVVLYVTGGAMIALGLQDNPTYLVGPAEFIRPQQLTTPEDWPTVDASVFGPTASPLSMPA